MKCPYCNYENESDFTSCPRCGLTQRQEKKEEGKSPVLSALRDNMFLVLCVLVSASCLGSMSFGGLPLIGILLTVFLWLTYAASRRGVADSEHLRCVSGTIYADYVLTSVLFWLNLALAILMAVLWLFFPYILTQLGEVLDEFPLYDIAGLMGFISVPGIVITVISTVIDLAILLIGVLGLRRIHRFARSLYRSIKAEDAQIEYATDASKWLIALAVVNAVSAASAILEFDASGFVADGCIAAAMIVASLLIRKYFTENK